MDVIRQAEACVFPAAAFRDTAAIKSKEENLQALCDSERSLADTVVQVQNAVTSGS